MALAQPTPSDQRSGLTWESRSDDPLSMPTVAFTADVVCPMTGPPLADAGVLVSGDRIVAVGDAVELRAQADRTVHTPGVLLPGLVNGHSHVELADANQLAKPGPHHLWVRAVEGFTEGWDQRRWERSAHRGVQQLLRAGVTATADVVHRGPGVPALSRAQVGGTSYLDVSHVDGTEADAVVQAVERSLGLPAQGRRLGIAPSGPHRLGAGVLQQLQELAAKLGVPMLIPAAASQAEVVAIWQGEGPLAEHANALGMQFEWLHEGGTELTPVRYLAQLGLLTPQAMLAHGCWIEDNEAELMARQGVGLAVSPRANARLQAGEAPLERFAQAGVPLVFGTDSAAAVDPPDVLGEAQAWVATAASRGVMFWPSPVGPIPLEEAAIRIATVDGAKTLGWNAFAGVLEPGRRADFVVADVQTSADTVYRDLVTSGPGRQVLTVLGGVRKARRPDAETPWPPIDHERSELPSAEPPSNGADRD